jgi:hypothetical protein
MLDEEVSPQEVIESANYARVVVEIRKLDRGPALLPYNTKDGEIVWNEPADPKISFAQYLRHCLECFTKESWQDRVFQCAEGIRMPRYQAAIAAEHWGTAWDTLTLPFYEQRSIYRRHYRAKNAPDIFFGVKPRQPRRPAMPDQGNRVKGVRMTPERSTVGGREGETIIELPPRPEVDIFAGDELLSEIPASGASAPHSTYRARARIPTSSHRPMAYRQSPPKPMNKMFHMQAQAGAGSRAHPPKGPTSDYDYDYDDYDYDYDDYPAALPPAPQPRSWPAYSEVEWKSWEKGGSADKWRREGPSSGSKGQPVHNGHNGPKGPPVHTGHNGHNGHNGHSGHAGWNDGFYSKRAYPGVAPRPVVPSAYPPTRVVRSTGKDSLDWDPRWRNEGGWSERQFVPQNRAVA